MFVQDLVRHAAGRYGDAPAVVEGSRTLSFRAFEAGTQRLGNALLAMGLRPGDRVASVLPNCTEELLTYVALARTGLLRVGLNARDTAEDHAFKVEDSGARAAITDGLTLPGVEFALSREDVWRLAQEGPEGPCDEPLDPKETYRLAYTGGTTGRSKGVILTLRTLQAQVTSYLLEHVPGIAPGDVMLHAAPVSHASGSYFLPHLARGACSVLLPRYRPAEFLETLQRLDAGLDDGNALRTFLVPTMMATLLDDPNVDDVALRHLRQISYGASPISPTTVAGSERVFGKVLAQTFGQAEAPMAITHLRPEEHDRVGSAGRPYTMVAVRVVDADDEDVPTGETGEIVCRGAIVSGGYWHRPDATAETFRHGWLHTGDVGYLDAEGYVYLQDRANDMIISGGFNVYPREVEDALVGHPAVSEAAVVSVPDTTWGEVVHAVVSVRSPVADDDLDTWMRERVAGFKRPRAYHVRDEALPKSAAGKLLRRSVRDELRAGLASGSAGDT